MSTASNYAISCWFDIDRVVSTLHETTKSCGFEGTPILLTTEGFSCFAA